MLGCGEWPCDTWHTANHVPSCFPSDRERPGCGEPLLFRRKPSELCSAAGALGRALPCRAPGPSAWLLPHTCLIFRLERTCFCFPLTVSAFWLQSTSEKRRDVEGGGQPCPPEENTNSASRLGRGAGTRVRPGSQQRATCVRFTRQSQGRDSRLCTALLPHASPLGLGPTGGTCRALCHLKGCF